MPIIIDPPWAAAVVVDASAPVIQGAAIGDGYPEQLLQGAVIGDGADRIIAPFPISENTLPEIFDSAAQSDDWRSSVVTLQRPAIPAVQYADLVTQPLRPNSLRLQETVISTVTGDTPLANVGRALTPDGAVAMPRGVEGGFAIRTTPGQLTNVSTVPTAVTADRASSTVRYAVVGVTRDSAGAALPGCRVTMLEFGALVTGANPVITNIISSLVDGSFIIDVPGNSDYLLIAYLPGSPDRAGITLHPLTPTRIG